MTLELYRIDDRLIHGQVVLGWGQPMELGFIVLVDDTVATSAWEQDLYRMAVPPGVDVYFHTVPDTADALARYRTDRRPGILLTADIPTMLGVVERDRVPAVNVGGIHHRADRTQRLPYVFLNPAEEELLRAIAAHGVVVTAQDVPSTRPVPLSEILAGVPA